MLILIPEIIFTFITFSCFCHWCFFFTWKQQCLILLICKSSNYQVFWIYALTNISSNTVKPVLSSTILSSHPLLSSHWAKSQTFCIINTSKVTLIERSSLLSGRHHLFQGPNLNFLCKYLYMQNKFKVFSLQIIVSLHCLILIFSSLLQGVGVLIR